MPTLSGMTLDSFTLRSQGKGSYATTAEKEWIIDLSSIIQGSTVTSAIISLHVDGTGGTQLRLNSGTNINITNVRNSEYDITSLFSGKTTYSSTDKLVFSYTSSVTTAGTSSLCTIHGNPSGQLTLTITYRLPYTACTAPTTVTLAKTTAAPQETVRLSWSGAAAGTNNPIASYKIYISSDGTNWTAARSGITNTYFDVTAPSTNGAKIYYSVQAIGTVSGYDSARSSATAMLTCVYTAPRVTNVKLDNGTVTVYKPSGGTATLSWTGTAGTNNPITKYVITRKGAALTETTSTSITVDAPAVGGSYYYEITPVGTYSNGSAIVSPTMYTYSDPAAPTSVSLAKSEAGKSETVRLSWSGAKAGTQNAITGYRVYRATSETGTYTQFGSDISSTAKSGYLDVVSDSRNGRSYYYKVMTLGAHSNSAQSSAVGLKTVWTKPTVSSISLSSVIVAPSGTSTLQFSVAAGTNNAVTGIEVYQGETLLATLGRTATSYTVTAGSAAGDQVSFYVKPLGTVEDGVLSSAAVLKSYGDVTAPTSVVAANSEPDAEASTTLSWSGADDGAFNAIQQYKVYRASSVTGTRSLLATVTGTSATVTAPASMGSSYYYWVEAVGVYTSATSTAYATVTAKVYTAPGAPVASVNPSVAGVGDTPVLSWESAQSGTNNPVTGYRVMRSTSESGTYTQLGSDLSAATLSLNVTAPDTMGASYYYRVYALAARTGFTISASSNTVQLTRKVYTACSAPANVSISATLLNPGSMVTISWSAGSAGTNNPITKYRVYRNTGNGYTSFQEVNASTYSVTDTVGASGTVYYYRVRAIGTISGFDSSDSLSVSVTSNSPPGAVSGLSYNILTEYYESGTLSIQWRLPSDVNSNIAKFDVQFRQQSEIGGEYSEWADYTVITVSSDPAAVYTCSGTFTSIPRGCGFQFRVRAVDALDLFSDWTESREFIRNKLPLAPSAVYPARDAVTYNRSPYIVFTVYADPDDHTQYVDIQVDAGAWTQVLSLGKNIGVTAVRVSSSLSVNNTHIIKVHIRDELGAVSDSISFYVNVQSIVWTRTIQRGVIISRGGTQFFGDELYLMDSSYADETITVNDASWNSDNLVVSGAGGISHQAEIEQMYGYVNTGRAYYGLSPITVPDAVGNDYSGAGAGKIGMFAAWGDQMAAMYSGLQELAAVRQETLPALAITSGMMPTASVINAIRTAIVNM